MGESVKVKKPVTAKSLNILLTITVVVSALVIVIGILFSQFATKEETGAIDDDNEKTTGALTTVFAVIAIIMLIAYFILLIICFVRSLRFRKLGGAKAIATLSVCAFVFGLIGILIFLVGAM
jgi:vacuolar-type H+-ATPase subunit I/STV1